MASQAEDISNIDDEVSVEWREADWIGNGMKYPSNDTLEAFRKRVQNF